MRRFLLALALTMGLVGTVAAAPAQAAYAGTDGRIVFVRANQIFTINADGTGLKQLTTGAKNYRPKWSPDGQRIAYLHETAAGRDLWVMGAAGANKQRVTQTEDAQAAAWSPNGKWLVFGSPLREVRSTAPFGTPVVLGARASECCSDEEWPVVGGTAWSPDGDHIAFATDNFPDSPDHYFAEYSISRHLIDALDATGGACCGEGWFADPFYGPDGSGPFYTTKVDPFEGQPGEPPQFFYQPTGTAAFPSRPYDQQGAPSPSGKRIAFMNNASGTAYVYVANVNGTGRQRLTLGYQPDWQPTNTVAWTPPPPVKPDLLPPILTPGPIEPRVGTALGTSNVFDATTSNDYSTIPVRLSWSAFDPESGVCGYDLDATTSGVVSHILKGSTATSVPSLASNRRDESGVSYTLTAHDCSGNATDAYLYPYLIVSDDSGLGPDSGWGYPLVFTGSWGVSTFSGASGGTTHKTSQAGAAARVTVGPGFGVSFVMAKAADRGVATILVDGTVYSTVDLFAAAPQNRMVVANVTVPQDGHQHTVSVVNQATPGRPRIDVDAVVLRL